jgi:hypothetical protein
MSKRVPLPAKEFFTLKPGDKFVVYWAKDDDPERVRLDYETQTVDSVERNGKEVTIFPTDAGYEWSSSETCAAGENVLDTSRGYAYLYKHTP